jgi:hypothetical protein
MQYRCRPIVNTRKMFHVKNSLDNPKEIQIIEQVDAE